MKSKIIIVFVLLLNLTMSFGQSIDTLTSKVINAINLARGINGQIDPKKSYQMLLAYANQGHSMAMNAVGRINLEGVGCPVNNVAGLEWLEKAGEAGYYSAWHNLGTLYKYGRSGVKQDFEMAFYYFDKLANAPGKSNIIGLYDAGYMLYKGLGCIQNYEKAFCYFKKASETFYSPAMYMLSLCYRNGYGTERKVGEANFWLSQAIKEGYQPAIDEYNSDGPENVPVYFKANSAKAKIASLENKKVLISPIEYTKIEHLKNIENNNLDGEFEGVLVTYDWSGKLVIKETPLSLTIKSNNHNFVAEWREFGVDTIQIKGIWTDSSLIFTEAIQYRTGHYDVKGKNQWTFTKAQLQIIEEDTSRYLAGNLQMYSTQTMEPNQPVYLNLRKIDKNNPVSSSAEGISVYPNPIEDGFNVSFYLQNESNLKLSIFKTDGQLVRAFSFGQYSKGQQNIMLKASLSTGTYVLKLNTGDKMYQTVLIKK